MMVCKCSIILAHFLVTLLVENGCQWNNLLADLNLLLCAKKAVETSSVGCIQSVVELAFGEKPVMNLCAHVKISFSLAC